MTRNPLQLPAALSIGIMAWNEEASIASMLQTLFGQSIFAHLAARGECCEIVCLANGCTDRTVATARQIFERVGREHPAARGIRAWVADIPEPGRNNAWNRFMHEFSAREARFLGCMDADILFNKPDTLRLVLGELESNPRLGGASDWPCKDIALKHRPSLRERISISTSEMTSSIEGRLNGQLYLLRAGIARNLYLPRDVVANDDGFFKAAICTDFFRAPSDPSRVVSVRGATHLYEPYLSFRDILNNQKRQMIGQTTVYVIVEYIKGLPAPDRAHLAETLRSHEKQDPDWLKKLIVAHLGHTPRFWNLFPGILGFRWRRLAQMPWRQRLKHLPATMAGFAVTLYACWQASRFLRRGVSTYWPKAERQSILTVPPFGAEAPEIHIQS